MIISSAKRIIGRRGICGVSPTLYLRSKSAFKPKQEIYDAKRAELYGLVRFTTHQLSVTPDDNPQKETMKSDLIRYKKILDEGIEKMSQQVAKEVKQQLEIVKKLDRYPSVSLENIKNFSETLRKKWESAQEILSKEFSPPEDFNMEYFNTSKFRLLDVYTGKIAFLPDGPVPPGAIELLPWQCIRTKVNGEDVIIEIEDYDEHYMALWFKPGIPVPENAEVLWEYPNETDEIGTKWEVGPPKITHGDTTDALQTSTRHFTEIIAPTDDIPVTPPVKPVFNDVLAPFLNTITKSTENKAEFAEALLYHTNNLKLKDEYASHYDREVVESKRNRYYSALLNAKDYKLPLHFDPVKIKLENTIVKCQQLDFLRQQEYYIGEEQILGRLHERRLAGEYILEEEELDYMPHVRDETELSVDYQCYFVGRYFWKLFPHTDLNEFALVHDVRFTDLPTEQDPLNRVLEEHEKNMSLHQKLERRLLTQLRIEHGAEELKQNRLSLD